MKNEKKKIYGNEMEEKMDVGLLKPERLDHLD